MKRHVRSTLKPKWYQFRWWVSRWLVRLAGWVKPDNPDLQAWVAEMMLDSMVYGKHIVRIDPMAFDETTAEETSDG